MECQKWVDSNKKSFAPFPMNNNSLPAELCYQLIFFCGPAATTFALQYCLMLQISQKEPSECLILTQTQYFKGDSLYDGSSEILVLEERLGIG